MFSSSRSLFFTLFLAITLLIALVPVADANGNTVPAHRRQANRMLRKRAPLPIPASTDPSEGGVLPIGVGQDPGKVSDTSTSTSTSASAVTTSAAAGKSTTSTSTSSSAVTSGVTSTSTTSSTTSTTILSTTSTNLTSTSTSTSSTSTSTTSSSTSSSTTTTSSSTQETLAVTSAPSDTAAVSRGPTTVTFTSSLGDSSPTASAAAASTNSASSSSGIGKATLTVIIVIASCVGGAIIIWTIIRKWKFSPSAEFEERMQPIDWQPTVEHNPRADDGIPGSLRRVTSNASHGSFHSGSDHDGRMYNGYSGASDQGHGTAIADLPSHDFTAGPAHLAPVGGYADLARGPSPQPQMTEALGRGNTINRGYGYDTYGPRY